MEEQESQGTAELAARGTAVSGDGGSQAETRKKRETWEDVCLQVKNAKGVFAKQPLRHLKRAGGSNKHFQKYNWLKNPRCILN
jgi:hypothetical protein